MDNLPVLVIRAVENDFLDEGRVESGRVQSGGEGANDEPQILRRQSRRFGHQERDGLFVSEECRRLRNARGVHVVENLEKMDHVTENVFDCGRK